MLPATYGLPVAIVLLVGGAVACFAGYRFFKIVLGIYGFILGAMLASSVMGVNNSLAMIAGALVGGVVGSVILVMAYFVGIALVGAGLGALIGHQVWSWFAQGDPPVTLVILVALVGGLGAMTLQRYMLIVATAFGGAWTMIVGAINVLATRGITRGSSATEVWILYPTSVSERWVPIAWIAIGVVGVAMQLAVTGKRKGK
jgi:hypothetical protein